MAKKSYEGPPTVAEKWAQEAQTEPSKNGPKAPPLSKRQRFLKWAPQRVKHAVKALARLGNCGAPASYEWRDSDRDEIFAAIDLAVKQMKGRFQPEALDDREKPFRFSSQTDEEVFDAQNT